MTDLCALDDVTVDFGGVRALDSVSLTLTSDDGLVGIIGPNGAGKSTLFGVLGGATRPTKGSVHVLGHSLQRNVSPERVARLGVARTFQIPRPFTGMSVRQNVEVARLASVRSNVREQADVVDDILERMRLSSMAGDPAGALPLAARKKLEVARAMAIDADLILLDEVFEGLSDSEIQEVVGILKAMHADGIHLIIVEHVIRALRQLVDALVVLEKGSIIAHGEVNEVLNDSKVREAYLGMSGGR